MDIQITPNQLYADLEVLYSDTKNAYGAGYAEALAQVGGLVHGIYSPGEVAKFQAERLDPDMEGYSQSYADGYTAQWNRLAMLTNMALVRANGYGVED